MWQGAAEGEKPMDYEVMRKKLDTYRKSNGQFKHVSGDLLVELLRMWESHTGASFEFAKKLGMRSKQLGSLIREGRRVATSTENVDPAFHALQLQSPASEGGVPCSGIEMSWGTDQLIRFPSVDTLWEFLKKAA
jgi:hypothetical protein